MAQHNELGKLGEEAASLCLKQKGYQILDQNWRFERYELDIVAKDGEWLVFVEVKTRTSAQWGNPQDAVGKGRIKRMVEAADLYIRQKDLDFPARFDIVGAIWNGESFEIEHIDDAFLPPVNV
jgi:putative endonuclease